MEGLIPYVFKAVTRRKNRRYYENLYGQTSSSDASFLDSDHKWEGKQQSHRHRRTMSLPSCLGQHHQIAIPIPAIKEEEKEEDENMNGCVGGGVIIFRKGGTKSLRLPSRNQRL